MASVVAESSPPERRTTARAPITRPRAPPRASPGGAARSGSRGALPPPHPRPPPPAHQGEARGDGNAVARERLRHPRAPRDQVITAYGLRLEQDAPARQREALGEAQPLGPVTTVRPHNTPHGS